jgi:SWI/SNF-related matrix-associated actin-dependent regulator 1 of chromatin subfamily A
LKLKWKREIKKFYPEAIVTIFDKEKEFYQVWDTDFCIISYSFCHKADVLFEWADMAVIDESHLIKSTETIRSQGLHRLVFENSLKSCIQLTGTPIVNRVHEFYSLLSVCKYAPWLEGKDDFLEKFPTYVDFANNFSYLNSYDIEVETKKGKLVTVPINKWSGLKNLEELKRIVKNHYIQYDTDKVLGLPEYQIIDIPVSYKDQPKLQEAFTKFLEEDSGVGPRIKAESALAKVKFTVDFVKDKFPEDRPVVVFTDHVESCHALAEALEVVAITGSTANHIRDKIAEDFMAGRLKRVVATIGSFSTGNDLQIASDMVFNDPNWVPGVMEQAMYRIIRIGQKNRCRFYRIVGSIQDEKIYDTLFEKIETIKEVRQGLA